jgi:HEAT repeat protein
VTIPELSIPQLAAQLKSADWAERFHAAFTLGQMGPGARAAVLSLTEAVGDADPNVRKMVAQALGNVGPEAAAAVEVLGDVLFDDAEPAVRRRAATALGRIGAEEAVPALEEAYDLEKDEDVREAIAVAVVEIDERTADGAA